MENVDEDIQSVLNTLVSRARAALTHLQDHEGEVLEAGRTPDQAYRSYWITQMSEEMLLGEALIGRLLIQGIFLAAPPFYKHLSRVIRLPQPFDGTSNIAPPRNLREIGIRSVHLTDTPLLPHYQHAWWQHPDEASCDSTFDIHENHKLYLEQTGHHWEFHPEVKSIPQAVSRELHHVRSLVGCAMVKSQVISTRLLNVHADSMGITQALETGGRMPALNLPAGTAESWDEDA